MVCAVSYFTADNYSVFKIFDLDNNLPLMTLKSI